MRFSELDKLKIKQAEKYIQHIDDLEDTLRDAEMKVALIRDMAQPGGIRYDGIQVRTSPTDDAIPNAVAAMEDVSDLEYLIEQIQDERARFCLMLRYDLTSVGATFMWTHYKYGIDYKDIATSAGIDVKTERTRRKEALLEMYEKDLLPLEYQLVLPTAL